MLFLAFNCTHYSTQERPEAQNVINAPIDVVWNKTLQVLPSERISLNIVNKDSYFISGKKKITMWSWGDDVSINLVPKGEKQTIMQFDAAVKAQLIDWGHLGRLAKSIFDRVKQESEEAYASSIHQPSKSAGKETHQELKPTGEVQSAESSPGSKVKESDITDLEKELTKLDEMKSKHLITDEEYTGLRKKLLEKY